ncbi:hypothetical protein CLIB1444_24S00606 [[Candida] jaroonii]|uniref:Uncharacterized protein n=1 Tax=[Candida] jaroonii TaxID=467808 RepID=A0ACA9YGH0_9ASCO|nr:hypothetical protein CLIB1444_24S00606 [[Candida] jaroonii]
MTLGNYNHIRRNSVGAPYSIPAKHQHHYVSRHHNISNHSVPGYIDPPPIREGHGSHKFPIFHQDRENKEILDREDSKEILDSDNLDRELGDSWRDLNVPTLSREFVVRRISEGETGRLKEELKCEACGKGYKHISSLAKHLWEHTPEWNVTKKLLISKHQQVQLLEAASILVGMNDLPDISRRNSVFNDDEGYSPPTIKRSNSIIEKVDIEVSVHEASAKIGSTEEPKSEPKAEAVLPTIAAADSVDTTKKEV